jgi:hypothetical protein
VIGLLPSRSLCDRVGVEQTQVVEVGGHVRPSHLPQVMRRRGKGTTVGESGLLGRLI